MSNPKQSEAIPLDKPEENSNAFSLEGASPSSEGDMVRDGMEWMAADGEESKQYYPNGGW